MAQGSESLELPWEDPGYLLEFDLNHGGLSDATGDLAAIAFTPPAVKSAIGWFGSKLSAPFAKLLSVLGRGKIGVDDVLSNPNTLRGMSPHKLQSRLTVPEGWRIETLGKGSHKGQGWMVRQYTPAGNPTGRQIRWHPGGGHHGSDPYWTVINGTGAPVKIGPQFPGG